MSKKLIFPSGRKSEVKLFHLAPRISILGGKTIALYHNDKVASFPVMRSIRKQLEPYEIKEVFEIHAGTPFSRHPDEAIEETSRADAVFVGTAD